MTFDEWWKPGTKTITAVSVNGIKIDLEKLARECWQAARRAALTEAAEIVRKYASGEPIAREIERARDGQDTP